MSTFYIVLTGRVALASPTATNEEQAPVLAAHKPARRRAHSAARLRDRPLPRGKTLGRLEAPAASRLAHVPEQVFAELGPGDSFGEEAIFALGEVDRDVAAATDTICALDYAARKYSAQRITRDLEFLAVRDEEVLASLLQVLIVRCRMLAVYVGFQRICCVRVCPRATRHVCVPSHAEVETLAAPRGRAAAASDAVKGVAQYRALFAL